MSKSVEKRLAAQTSLTDEEIDRLSGVALRDAVAMAIGWDSSKVVARYPHVQTPRPVWHTDQGAALGLLMGLKQFVKICLGDGIVVYGGGGEILASGSKQNAAEHFCRAYLKLVNQKES